MNDGLCMRGVGVGVCRQGRQGRKGGGGGLPQEKADDGHPQEHCMFICALEPHMTTDLGACCRQ